MNGLFLKIINISISASWLILAVLLLRLVLKRAPKWVNVLLWGIVAVRLVFPFSIESALSLIPSAETIPMDIEMAAQPAINSGISVINRVVNPMLSSFAPQDISMSANPLQIWIPIFSIVWLAGAAALLLYTVISYWRLHKKVSEAVILRDNIYQSENVASPFVLGIIRPKIYLPFKIDSQNLEHVIAHEHAHIHRKDHWWKPLGFLLLTIHWFNPLMWFAYMLLCRDIELACDEKVIRELDNEQKADYTQALVACSVNRRMIAACPLAFGEVGVKDRVKSVMNYKRPAFWIIVLSVIVCVVVSVCFLTNPAVSVDEKSEKLAKEHFAVMTSDNVQEDSPKVVKWFDYLAAPDEMHWDGRLEIDLPEFPDVTFRWYPEKMEAVTKRKIIPLYTGMPIWNTYFCDLTGDGLPELCSTISFGSGMIDNRIIIYDYANGASYNLQDRGIFDYTLRQNESDSQLYIDKKSHMGSGLLNTGQLVFEDESIQVLWQNMPTDSIQEIVDPTDDSNFAYDTAAEKIYEDENNKYFLSGLYSQYVIVHYIDGAQEDIVTALNAGRATIADLDKFGIRYWAEPKD